MFSVVNCTVAFKIINDDDNFQQQQQQQTSLTDQQFLAIAQHGANTEYCPSRFHAIIMRIRTRAGRTVAALVFRSARVVLTGVPHPDKAQTFAQRVLRRLQHTQQHITTTTEHQHHHHHHHLPFVIYQLRVVNIVGVHTFGQRVSVERLEAHIRAAAGGGGGSSCIYEPSMFPALRWRLPRNSGGATATCLLYISGKVVVTGVATMCALRAAFAFVQDTVVPNYFR
ncbi:hypothetical protein niasHT_032057 [Heterodera trifolii]|uniref:TATA-box binding protein n=1 Tax=Heterodera trifolii TaxID=157864 RepID=A0ABD2HWK9_9BILA